MVLVCLLTLGFQVLHVYQFTISFLKTVVPRGLQVTVYAKLAVCCYNNTMYIDCTHVLADLLVLWVKCGLLGKFAMVNLICLATF